jgi:integral membrane protein
MLGLLNRFEAARPFTEAEAWMLFRIAAISEACGWALLGSGILISRYITPGNDTAVLIAGQTHGMIFFAYVAAAAGLYPSLGWSRWRAVFALAFSVPPFGTLLFEQWAAHRRAANGFSNYRNYLIYTALQVAG